MRFLKVFSVVFLLFLNSIFTVPGQEADTLTLLFIGDIMGHDSQINSAYSAETKSYDYEEVFKPVAPVISKADFAIANLEVTLAGPPFKGYPQFSSPDELAVACKNSGMDVLITANNHSCDRSKKGIIRTIDVLDSLGIQHTGTFKNEQHRKETNLLILEKNGIKAGLLNYTYGTNGLKAPPPTSVNYLYKNLMAGDIRNALENNQLDKLIVAVHWGTQYQTSPNKKQTDLAEFLLEQGADMIIGSHPHVLQKMVWEKDTLSGQEHLVVYSLGNFVSNQRTRRRDGGAMVEISLVKQNNQTHIADAGYYLTWVHKTYSGGKWHFHILPAAGYENKPDFFHNKQMYEKMKVFLQDSRQLLEKENIGMGEMKYRE